MENAMRKELVVVVHGVGVREAGVSTDLLSLALDPDAPQSPEGQARRADPALARADAAAPALPDWRPHSSDDFHLREPARHARRGLHSTFGARVRRYRVTDPGSSTYTVQRERVVADFYWGDISGTGGDLWRVVLGFVKIVLGLSHAIRENAASVWPENPALRRLAGAAALVVHGPVFALNLVLLGGLLLAEAMLRSAPLLPLVKGLAPGLPPVATVAVLCLLAVLLVRLALWAAAPDTGRKDRSAAVEGVPVLAAAAFWLGAAAAGWAALLAMGPVWATSLCAVAGGWVLGRLSHAYLLRHLGDWLILSGLAIPPLMLAFGPPGTGLPLMRDLAAPETTGAVHALGDVLVLAAVVTWGMAVAAGIVLLLAKRVWPKRPRDGDFLAAAIGLMTLLSFILVAAVWGTLAQLPLRAMPTDGAVAQALSMAVPAVLVLVIVLVASGLVAIRARAELAGAEADYMNDPDLLARRHRLIVSPAVIGLTETFLVLLAGLMVAGFVLPVIGETLVGFSDKTLPVIAAGAALAVGALRHPLAMGIGIATDVLVYLNSYSWVTHPTGPRKGSNPAPGRTLLERAIGLKRLGRAALGPALETVGPLADPAQDRLPRGYWMRHRIQDRLATLVAELLANEDPDRVIIVAHSQGTVIALDTLDRDGPGWAKGRELRLVTMGSPYTHVYNRYFPLSFPPHRERENLAPGGVLAGWTNIFRVDDFVGTHIDAPRNRPEGNALPHWPTECAVPTGGHTMYWVDEAVYSPLRTAVEAPSDPGQGDALPGA
jgi:hypothetical protein